MPTKQRITIFIINAVIAIAVIVSASILMRGWGVLTQTVIYGLSSLFLIADAVVFCLKRDKLLKSAFVLLCCLAVVYLSLVVTDRVFGLSRYESDEDKLVRLADLIRSTGAWGMVVFVILQILQVLVLPLPAVLCYVSGVAIWGAWIAFGLACLGVVTGSVLCFFIGRKFGKKAVYWIVGRETVEKYSEICGNRGKVPFVMMQILPFFPDDILCIVVGLSNMGFGFFIATMLTVRPAVIAVYCFLGSGEVIPFSGWGIPVWIAIIAVCAVVAVVIIKYQSRIESFFKRKFTRKELVAENAPLPNAVSSEESGDTAPTNTVEAEESDGSAVLNNIEPDNESDGA